MIVTSFILTLVIAQTSISLTALNSPLRHRHKHLRGTYSSGNSSKDRNSFATPVMVMMNNPQQTTRPSSPSSFYQPQEDNPLLGKQLIIETCLSTTNSGERACDAAKIDVANKQQHVPQHRHHHHHSKQITRKINSCGTNCSKALDILYETQPFLNKEHVTLNADRTLSMDFAAKYTFDAKPIVAVIQLLAKNNNFSVPLDLLSTVIQLHKAKVIPTYYLLSVYKTIIGMLVLQEQKLKLVNLHRQILHYIHIEIPNNIQSAPPMDVYHVTLSALGKCRQMEAILDLLNCMETQQTITTIENNNDMDQSSPSTVQLKHPLPDRMAYLAALNSGIRCKSPQASLEIMNRMKSRGMTLDAVVYNHVLSSLANKKIKERYELVQKIWQDMEGMNMCTDSTYKLLIQIFTKECQWSDVAAAKSRMEAQKSTMEKDGGKVGVAVDGEKEPLTPGYIADLEKLQRVSTCKKPWYRLGRVQVNHEEQLTILPESTIVFGIQQHKNPKLNGLSLVFYTVTGEKLGYMLIRNELEVGKWNEYAHDIQDFNINGKMLFSSIMGMYIDESHRGKGLARYFLGIWLSICLRTQAFPRSEKINKPLLSLALSNFGFQAVCDSAFEVEVCPIEHIQETTCTIGPIADLGWEPKFALYTKHPMNFSERELRIQSMILTRVPPNPRGKIIAVKTCFEHPMTLNARRGDDFFQEMSTLSESIQSLWGKSSFVESISHEKTHQSQQGVDFFIDDGLLKRVIFGYLY